MPLNWNEIKSRALAFTQEWKGEGCERIYLVEPTGAIKDDPDLTDRKYPGNPTKSYRSTYPFKVVGEVKIWQGHPYKQVKEMKEHLERLKEQGINSLND